MTDKYKKKSVDGCRECPPRKACEGAEISFVGSGCVEGGGEITLRQPGDQEIEFHVECPGNGRLSIKTCEALEGGGDFYANAKCNEDVNLCINTEWLHKFVSSRVCDGELTIITSDDMKGGGKFTANQCNNTNVVLSVNWEKFPACDGGGLVWQGGCWKVDPDFITGLLPSDDDDDGGTPDLDNHDDPNYPLIGVRMWGEIHSANDKSSGECEIGFCSKTTDGKNCVTIEKAGFEDPSGKQESWFITCRFAHKLPTKNYIVQATIKKGSYDHCVSIVNEKDNGFLNPEDGFTIVIHDVENNTSMPGSDSRANSNHVCDVAFCVIY